ncbi:MAG: GNAT family N-acetyltransferase [Candidatus Thermoplasmatota archaeon]
MVQEQTKKIGIEDITPSQLYLSSERLKSLEGKNQDLEPLPVKHIGDRLFFTDGHHRAFTLFRKGRGEIEVYEDEDDLDWLEYLICLDWCEKEGIGSISDLDERIVSEKKFKELWIGRCQCMHEKVDEDMFHYINIKEERNAKRKSDICESVVRSLPEWFEIEKAILDYIEGVKDKYFLSVKVGDIPVGFVSIKEHNEYTSELYVLGIVEELHGRGIGKRLFEVLEEKLSNEGKKFLTVKTLSSSHLDENYKKTREFYSSIGFYPLEEFEDIWGEDNPCLFMVKVLG